MELADEAIDERKGDNHERAKIINFSSGDCVVNPWYFWNS
jgi:hypothetical protein